MLSGPPRAETQLAGTWSSLYTAGALKRLEGIILFNPSNNIEVGSSVPFHRKMRLRSAK